MVYSSLTENPQISCGYAESHTTDERQLALESWGYKED